MATRVISTSIKLDGEAEFKKQLGDVNSNLRTLDSEMKLVTEQFNGQANSADALRAKQKVLTDQIEQQEEKVKALKKAVEDSTEAFGENSKKTDGYKQSLNRAETELSKMQRELKETNGYLDEAEKSADGTAKSIDEFGNKVKGSGSKMEGLSDKVKSIGDHLSGLEKLMVGGAIIDGFKALGSAMANMVSESEEYRKIMGGLEVSSEAAGYTAVETSEAYKKLYSVLGDTQTAATTVANLQAIGLSQEDLMEIVDATTGVWAKYGDSMPIDGLAESINETIRAGEVTGTFADVLNWGSQEGETFGVTLKANTKANEEWNKKVKEATTAEDFFNLALEECETQADRANLMMKAMSDQGLNDLADAYEEANGDIMAANAAQAEMDEAMARLSEKLSPLVTGFKEFGAEALTSVIDQSDGLISKLTELPAALQNASSPEEYAAVAAKIVAELAEGLADKAPEVVEAGVEMLSSFLSGLMEGDSPEKIANAIAEVIMTLVDGAEDLLPEIVKFAIQLIATLTTALVGHIPDLAAKIPDIIFGIVNALLEGLPQITDVGLQLIMGLWEGWKSWQESLIRNVTETIDSVVSWVKEKLGIHSPSRVFMGIGEYMMQGLAIGMENSKGEVMETAEDIVNEVKSRFDELTGGLDTVKSIGDLQYDIWEMTYGKNATEAEKYDAKLDILNKQESAQADIVEAAAAAYEEVSELYGENSTESYKYQKTMLEEQKEYYKLLDAIQEVIAAKEALGELDSQSLSDINSGAVLRGLATASIPAASSVSANDVYNAVAAGVNAFSAQADGQDTKYIGKTVLAIDGREFAKTTQVYYREVNKSNPEVVSDTL